MKNITQLSTNQLEPNPLQPRGNIDPESIKDLIESVKEHGILEPLVIAHTPAGYQIIAGERRWRAARFLKLPYVPVVIKKTNPQQMLEMAIVENIQRKDLNPLERASGFLRLKEEFSLNNKEISQKVSRSVPYIINSLRLIDLPDTLKDGLLSGLITEGHARALGSIKDIRLTIEAYKIVLKEKASVRRAEDIARRMKKKIEEGEVPITKENIPQFLKSNLDNITKNMKALFAPEITNIKIIQTNVVTRITIQFKGSTDERLENLNILYQKLCNKKIKTSQSESSQPQQSANT
ncbi:ParB/RepB/Spo0J family partition protein [Patescibacteria group bacterium]|nr:ParB/RepB/Spo0J family partition protein [Patescibacteria group bacterium]